MAKPLTTKRVLFYENMQRVGHNRVDRGEGMVAPASDGNQPQAHLI